MDSLCVFSFNVFAQTDYWWHGNNSGNWNNSGKTKMEVFQGIKKEERNMKLKKGWIV
ncbi:MAG: hypothetical protein P8I11_04505 [Bacteroidia bacterium]|nr:hypothetical protein [Bacteroidia bacterium]